MTFTIRVKTRARKVLVRQIDSQHLEVAVTQSPIEGKANNAVIEALATYFQLPKNRIQIVSGQKSKMKVVQVS